MEKSKIEKINLNFGGVNLNGILIPEASSTETIKNLLELRSQVNYFIDLLESMRPEMEKEKVYTDVIPIPPETKSLAQRAQEFQQEKEKKSTTIKGSFEIKDKKEENKVDVVEVLETHLEETEIEEVEDCGKRKSSRRCFSEGQRQITPYKKKYWYTLNSTPDEKLINVKNILSFNEKVTPEILGKENVLRTKIFEDNGIKYILLSVFCSVMNTAYSNVNMYANENSDVKLAIALFEDETGRESSRKFITLDSALHLIKQYNIKIKIEDMVEETQLKFKCILPSNKYITKKDLKAKYFEAKPTLAYIMNNCKYPWYFVNGFNINIKNAWEAYSDYIKDNNYNFEEKKRLFNNFIDVASTSFDNRYSKNFVREDVNLCREALVVYDADNQNYYCAFASSKDKVSTVVKYVNNMLDEIIEKSYTLRDKMYTHQEVAVLCDRSISWVKKAAEHLGIDTDTYLTKDNVKDLMHLSTRSVVTESYADASK